MPLPRRSRCTRGRRPRVAYRAPANQPRRSDRAGRVAQGRVALTHWRSPDEIELRQVKAAIERVGLYEDVARVSVLRLDVDAGSNRNALKHGATTAEALAFKREIAALARMARETMAAIE
jgi:hypothetical protein